MVLLTNVLVVVAKAKHGVMSIIYTLLTMEEMPVAVSPIFYIRMKKMNHTPNENNFCIIVGVATFKILFISSDSSL